VKGSKQIVLIEMLAKVGADIGRSSRWGMLQDLRRHGVEMLTNAKAKEITPAGVLVETATGLHEIPADTVVLAVGARSYNPLEERLVKSGIPYKVIGDAKRVAKAFDAIHEGYNAAREL
jgi:2,4-dienoyl-CoA reductase (NADPH2)